MNIQDGFYKRYNAGIIYTRDGLGWYLDSKFDYRELFEKSLWPLASRDYQALSELILPEEYLK